MPIILSMVPYSVTQRTCHEIREEVRVALRMEGVARADVTMEFYPCLFPECLVIIYLSRSDHLRKADQADREAKIVGQIIESHFQLPIECFVLILKKEDTGIFLTQKEEV